MRVDARYAKPRMKPNRKMYVLKRSRAAEAARERQPGV